MNYILTALSVVITLMLVVDIGVAVKSIWNLLVGKEPRLPNHGNFTRAVVLGSAVMIGSAVVASYMQDTSQIPELLLTITVVLGLGFITYTLLETKLSKRVKR
ncbi:MAG: hypothetical protein WD231_00780 [Candidatus Woykebacteria bacterium]